jgi:hypothetical protein
MHVYHGQRQVWIFKLPRLFNMPEISVRVHWTSLLKVFVHHRLNLS